MSDRYEINRFDEVVPYTNGRRDNDTRNYRDATELELQQRDEIDSLENEIAQLRADRAELLEAFTDVVYQLEGMYDKYYSGKKNEEYSRCMLFIGENIEFIKSLGGDMSIHLSGRCFLCGRYGEEIRLKPIGSYRYGAYNYKMYLCQYCRASRTRWNRKLANIKRMEAGE